MKSSRITVAQRSGLVLQLGSNTTPKWMNGIRSIKERLSVSNSLRLWAAHGIGTELQLLPRSEGHPMDPSIWLDPRR